MVELGAEELEALRRIIDFEDKKEQKFREQGFDAALVAWELLEVPVSWKAARKLIMQGIVKKLGKKWYALADREQARKLLRLEPAPPPQPEGGSEEIEVPPDLFSVIEGYDDVKSLFQKCTKATKPFHVLLIGPPSSAKTLFLLELNRLPGAFYCLGGSTTKVGLIDQLFEFAPRFLLVDELEKMNKLDYAALLSLMETGIVKETKHDKAREIRLETFVIAACNSTRRLPPELMSRFHFKLHFREYSPEEFERVAVKTLTVREKVDPELAAYIARKSCHDIREAVGLARAATTKEEVDELLRLKQKYSKPAV